jgi:hypothetical protein
MRMNRRVLIDAQNSRENIMAAHTEAKSAIKSTRSSLPVGLTLAMEDDQSPGPGSRFAEEQSDVYGPWLKLAKQDDFIVVQTYTRARVAAKSLPAPENTELTQMGTNFIRRRWSIPFAMPARRRECQSSSPKMV